VNVERYSEYKEGTDLVTSVPSSWDVKPLKYAAACNLRVLPESADEEAEISYIDIGSVEYGKGIGSIQEFAFANAPSRARRIVHEGDTIISTVRTYLKAVAYISERYDNFIRSTGFAVFTPKPEMDRKFFSYALLDVGFISDVERHSAGVSYPAITSSALASLKAVFPPIKEQTAIATYLDRRTAEIDGLLADLARQAGMGWIGKVPTHWQIAPLRAFLKVVSVKNNADLPLLSVEREKGVVDRETEGSENNHNRIPEDLSNYKVVREGQFVMNKMKAWRGSYGVSNYDGIVSPAYYVFALNFPTPAFFNYAIRNAKYIGFFGRDSYGIRTDQWDLKIGAIKDIPLAVPPVEDQQAIVDYLDSKIPLIEGLIADITAQIEKLKQYVIHDAVTGKIKVTEG
jgi:type I restriction enzyme S subunit